MLPNTICQRFTLTLEGTEVFVNDERTRTFISLPMRRKGPEGQQAYQQVRAAGAQHDWAQVWAEQGKLMTVEA